MPTQENAGGISPTELGKPYGLTPRQVNEILVDARLQERRSGQSGWTPTDAGAAFVFEQSSSGAKPISWLPSVSDVIAEAVRPVIQFIETRCYLSQHARTPLPDLWVAYQQWSQSEGIERPLTRSIFDQLVAKHGAKCYPCPEGRVAVDLALVDEASEQMRLDATQQQAALDQIAQFIETQCRRSTTTRTPAEVFYDAYKDWTRDENNGRAVGYETFFERLEYYGYPQERDPRGVQVLVGLQLIGRRPRLKVI